MTNAQTVKLREPAIGRHKTPVDKSGSWDGTAVTSALPNESAALRYVHAYFKGDEAEVKGNYSLPHHKAETGSAAVISGVNQALARMNQVSGIGDAIGAVEAHLRGHRIDAGLEESMSGGEVRAAVEQVADTERLSEAERHQLLGACIERELAIRETVQQREAVTVHGDVIALREQAVGADGTALIKIIEPGWGSSGYYPRDVLERDIPRVFAPGSSSAKMFWNHATDAEESARPEGDLRDLAGEIVTEPVFQEGPSGPGMYARAKVHDSFQGAVNELAPYIGVSIRANGRGHQGTVEGRKGSIVDELVEGISVDYVTTPGAGGQIVSLFESYRRGGPRVTVKTKDPKKLREALGLTEHATDEEVKTRLDAVADLTTDPDGNDDGKNGNENDDDNKGGEGKGEEQQLESRRTARLEERLAMREARDIVEQLVEAQGDVPDATAKRLVADLPRKFKLNAEGELDADAFRTIAEAAVKAEVDYIAEVRQPGRVRGMGGGGTPAAKMTTEQVRESNDKIGANLVKLGSTEKAAELAMKG